MTAKMRWDRQDFDWSYPFCTLPSFMALHLSLFVRVCAFAHVLVCVLVSACVYMRLY